MEISYLGYVYPLHVALVCAYIYLLVKLLTCPRAVKSQGGKVHPTSSVSSLANHNWEMG